MKITYNAIRSISFAFSGSMNTQANDCVFSFSFYLMHHDIIEHLFLNPLDKSFETTRMVSVFYSYIEDLVEVSTLGSEQVFLTIAYTMVYIKRYCNAREQHILRQSENSIEDSIDAICLFAYRCSQIWIFDDQLYKKIWNKYSKMFLNFENFDDKRFLCFIEIFDWNLDISKNEYTRELLYLNDVHNMLAIRYGQTGTISSGISGVPGMEPGSICNDVSRFENSCSESNENCESAGDIGRDTDTPKDESNCEELYSLSIV